MGKHHRRLTPNLPLRQQVEAEIERLIALCDSLDGDPEMEPDADSESSLGGLAVSLPDGSGADDCEYDSADNEFSLGWTLRQSEHQALLCDPFRRRYGAG